MQLVGVQLLKERVFVSGATARDALQYVEVVLEAFEDHEPRAKSQYSSGDHNQNGTYLWILSGQVF